MTMPKHPNGPIPATIPGKGAERTYQWWSRRNRQFDVTILAVPSNSAFKVGARFDRHSFRCTLRQGYWPEGMVFSMHGKDWIVDYDADNGYHPV